MDLEKYLDLYKNVSREDLEKIKECVSCDSTLEWRLRCLHENREKEKLHGRPALVPGPLIHVLSISVQSKKEATEPLSIYGWINVEYPDSIYGGMIGHALYKRESNVAECIGMSGNLTINGPDYSCWSTHAYIPLLRNRINVELFDGAGNVFARECFSLGESEDALAYEQVKSMCIDCKQGSISVHYVVIPFGVYCRIELLFDNSQNSGKRAFVDVNGKVIARYANTYGNYALEESVLFEKQGNEYERVEIDQKAMQLSRCWVTLPAYSSLVVDVDLSEFSSGQKIVKDTVKFLAQPGLMFGDTFVLDDLFIQVHVAWFLPSPMGPCKHEKACLPSPVNVLSSVTPTAVQGSHEQQNIMEQGDQLSPRMQAIAADKMDAAGYDVEDIDREDEDLQSSSSSGDELSVNLNLSRGLHAHKSKPWPSPAVEIFSVFIGRERSHAQQIYGSHIYGSIELLSNDRICYIFKRNEHNALLLSQESARAVDVVLDVLDGSRVYDEFNPLEMKIDIKDIEGHLSVKGYVDWHASALEDSLWRDKNLCAFIQGTNGGFVAVHYSIFLQAVQANIKVSLLLKTELANSYPKVYGSLITQYNNFDYSSRHDKEYYRSVLFRRIEDDSIDLNIDFTLPLSRSILVVPSHSSLLITVDLNLSTGVSCAKEIEIEIGECLKTIETNDYLVRIELDWCEIK